MADLGLFFVQRANTLQDGTRYRWVSDPNTNIVYVDHRLDGEAFAAAVGEGARALIDEDYADAHRKDRARRPQLRLIRS